MGTGAFLDRSAPPGAADLAYGLDEAHATRWRRLTGWLAETYGLDPEVLWSGAEDGWVARYRRSGASLTTLMPQAGGSFRALVVVGPKAWPAVPELPLSAATRSAWEGSRPYPDGRWLWLAVDDDAVEADVCALIACKSPPPKRPRRRTS